MNELLVIIFLLPWLSFVFLKIYEMLVYSVINNLRCGIKISQTFVLKKTTEGVQAAILYLSEQRQRSNCMFQFLYSECLNQPIRVLCSLIYKWPVMIVMASTLLYFFSWLRLDLASVILSGTCILLISIEIAHEVMARLTLSRVDNFRCYVSLDPCALNNPERIFYDRDGMLRDFLATILIQLICFTFAFSALYFTLSNFDDKAFSQPLKTPIDAIYLTVVVVGTIGFGDIVPLTQLSRVLLILNVGTTMLFVVFIALHFVATLSDTPENIIK